jgi:hypothetical protein
MVSTVVFEPRWQMSAEDEPIGLHASPAMQEGAATKIAELVFAAN